MDSKKDHSPTPTGSMAKRDTKQVIASEFIFKHLQWPVLAVFSLFAEMNHAVRHAIRTQFSAMETTSITIRPSSGFCGRTQRIELALDIGSFPARALPELREACL